MEKLPKSSTFFLCDVIASMHYVNFRHEGRDGDGTPYHIDLVFSGTKHLEIPFAIRNPAFADATSKDLSYLESKLGPLREGQNPYVLVSGGTRFYIVAAGYYIERNTVSHWKSAIARDLEIAAAEAAADDV